MAGDGGGGRGAAAVPAAAGAGAPRVPPAGEGIGRGGGLRGKGAAALRARGSPGCTRGRPGLAAAAGPRLGCPGRLGAGRASPGRASASLPVRCGKRRVRSGPSPFAPASLRLRLRLLPCPPVSPGLKARLFWDGTLEPAGSVEHVKAGRAGGIALQAVDKELRLGGKSCITEVLLRSCAGALAA